MIKVFYIYYAKHSASPIETSKEFKCWQKALRFMKLIDSGKINGYVTGYACDDAYDNEMLSRRYTLHHPAF